VRKGKTWRGNRLSHSDRLEILERVAAGEGLAQVAGAVGCGISTVKRVLVAAGGRPPRRRNEVFHEPNAGACAGVFIAGVDPRNVRSPSRSRHSATRASGAAGSSYSSWRRGQPAAGASSLAALNRPLGVRSSSCQVPFSASVPRS
jgi:hypothetical protein